MAMLVARGKLYDIVTIERDNAAFGYAFFRRGGRTSMIVGLASMIFIALFGWGHDYFHWSDPNGDIQLALGTSFVLGILAGYKSRG